MNITQLSNGLRILELPKMEANSFVVGFIATTGSLLENLVFPAGITKLAQQMLWTGTEKHSSSKRLNLHLAELGGAFKSQVSFEQTSFFITVPAYNQSKAVTFLSEIIQNSLFDARDLQLCKKNLIANNTLKNGLDINENIILEEIFGRQAGKLGESEVDTVMSIDRQNILDFYDSQFIPSQSILVIAGCIDSKLKEQIEKDWEMWRTGSTNYYSSDYLEVNNNFVLPKIIYRQKGSSETKLGLNFVLGTGDRAEEEAKIKYLTKSDESQLWSETLTIWARILILNTILGQSQSSRLWTKGVEEEFLFEDVSSRVVHFKAAGWLEIRGICENSQFSFALESVLATIEGLKKTTVSINELARAKEQLRGQLILEHEDLLTSTKWYLHQLLNSQIEITLEDLLQEIKIVQAAELRALAIDLFSKQNLILNILGTSKETKLVNRLVSKYLS